MICCSLLLPSIFCFVLCFVAYSASFSFVCYLQFSSMIYHVFSCLLLLFFPLVFFCSPLSTIEFFCFFILFSFFFLIYSLCYVFFYVYLYSTLFCSIILCFFRFFSICFRFLLLFSIYFIPFNSPFHYFMFSSFSIFSNHQLRPVTTFALVFVIFTISCYVLFYVFVYLFLFSYIIFHFLFPSILFCSSFLIIIFWFFRFFVLPALLLVRLLFRSLLHP